MEVFLNFTGVLLGSTLICLMFSRGRLNAIRVPLVVSLIGAIIGALILPTCLCSNAPDKFLGGIVYSVGFGFLWAIIFLILRKMISR